MYSLYYGMPIGNNLYYVKKQKIQIKPKEKKVEEISKSKRASLEFSLSLFC